MTWNRLSLVVLAFVLCAAGVSAQAPVYDLVIAGGTIFDGSGGPAMTGDIGIKDGKIAAIGRITPAPGARTFSAAGAIVAPGFIDIHTHGDRGIIADRLKSAQNYIAQGVTTLVTGNCGDGTFDVAQYFDRIRQQGAGPNIVHLVGHGTVRGAVMQSADRAPTPEELGRMKALVEKAMREGAAGLSSGLFYAPGSYAKVEEVVELARVVKEFGGIYTSHIRDESNYTIGLKASIEEAIEVGEKAGVPVQISHIKALGKPVWGQAPEICRIIEAAQGRGVRVFADQYPYNASPHPHWRAGSRRTAKPGKGSRTPSCCRASGRKWRRISNAAAARTRCSSRRSAPNPNGKAKTCWKSAGSRARRRSRPRLRC